MQNPQMHGKQINQYLHANKYRKHRWREQARASKHDRVWEGWACVTEVGAVECERGRANNGGGGTTRYHHE
jgi:hypothetical protein